MTDNDTEYMKGQRQVWVELLRTCVVKLGYDKESSINRIVEREEMIAMLRHVCSDHGDNDWPNELYLPDIIEKHLANHLG